MIETKGQKRLDIIDFLKALAVIFVILDHTASVNKALLDRSAPVYILLTNKAVPIFMLLSGFTFALSAKDGQLREMYGIKRLGRKLLRLTIPTVITYALFLALKLIAGKGLGFSEAVKCFLLGQYGYGAYYYAVMVQFVLIAPILLHLIRRYEFHGVIIAGLLNLFYEVSCSAYHLDARIYRVLFFRYLFITALGIYMYETRDKKIGNRVLVEMLAVGVIYVLLPSCLGWEYRVFTYSPWNKTGMMSAFYVFPIIYIIMCAFSGARADGVFKRTAALTGRASYHIMYTQLMYFNARSFADKNIIDIKSLPHAAEYAINIVVPVALGILFYYADNFVFGSLYREKRENCKSVLTN